MDHLPLLLDTFQSLAQPNVHIFSHPVMFFQIKSQRSLPLFDAFLVNLSRNNTATQNAATYFNSSHESPQQGACIRPSKKRLSQGYLVWGECRPIGTAWLHGRYWCILYSCDCWNQLQTTRRTLQPTTFNGLSTSTITIERDSSGFVQDSSSTSTESSSSPRKNLSGSPGQSGPCCPIAIG